MTVAPSQSVARTRCFAAVMLDADAARPVGELALRVRERLEGVKWQASWEPPTSYHLTLKFLGAIEAEQVEAMRGAMREVADVPAFELALGGLGGFPSLSRANVLWLGVTEGATHLGTLAARIETSAAKCGLAAAEHAFSPHVTLARVKRQGSSSAREVEAMASRVIATMRVREVALVRSTPGREGSVYTLLEVGRLAEG